MRKNRKLLSVMLSMALLLTLSPITASADDGSGGAKVIEEYKVITEEKELNKIIDDFDLNKDIPDNIKITKENSKVKIEQELKKSIKKSGEIIEQNSMTVIEEIKIPLEANGIEPLASNRIEPLVSNGIEPLASKGDDGSDPSASCKVSSTVYYDKVTYNGKASVKMTKTDWNVACNSGVRAYAFVTKLGQTGTFEARNQIVTTTHPVPFISKSGTETAPSNWVPVVAVFGNGGSTVGMTMNITLGRSASGSKWTYTFTNNLR